MDTAQQTLKDQLQFGLGDRLSKALHVAGVSTTEMADELEVARSTISNYLNDHTKPKRLYLRMWALKTGVPLEWLETGIFPETPETEKAPTPKGEGDGASYRTRTGPYALQGDRTAEIIPLFQAA